MLHECACHPAQGTGGVLISACSYFSVCSGEANRTVGISDSHLETYIPGALQRASPPQSQLWEPWPGTRWPSIKIPNLNLSKGHHGAMTYKPWNQSRLQPGLQQAI